VKTPALGSVSRTSAVASSPVLVHFAISPAPTSIGSPAAGVALTVVEAGDRLFEPSTATRA
jgi:hypothetical protein